MTQAIKNLSSSESVKPMMLNSLLAAIFLAAAVYVYFVGSAVSGAVQSEKTTRKIAEIGAQKIELEKRYMKLTEKIDSDYAYAAGFRYADETAYATRYGAFAQR